MHVPLTLSTFAIWLWGMFLVSWWLAALWTNRAISRGKTRHQVLYFLGFAIGFTLLFDPVPTENRHALLGLGALLPGGWQVPLWRDRQWQVALLLVIEFAAFAFAWWARIHLGKLWSGMLTLREGHRVIDTGPYAIVRHPIYTAFITASWAFALVAARPPVLLGAIVLTLVMAIKADTEERLLERELGPSSYESYRRRVPMLVPWARL